MSPRSNSPTSAQKYICEIMDAVAPVLHTPGDRAASSATLSLFGAVLGRREAQRRNELDASLPGGHCDHQAVREGGEGDDVDAEHARYPAQLEPAAPVATLRAFRLLYRVVMHTSAAWMAQLHDLDARQRVHASPKDADDVAASAVRSRLRRVEKHSTAVVAVGARNSVGADWHYHGVVEGDGRYPACSSIVCGCPTRRRWRSAL